MWVEGGGLHESDDASKEIFHGRMPGDVVLRRRRLRIHRLRRSLAVPALFSTGYGNVGSSIYYALGVTALYALGAAPLALLAAGVFFVLTVLTYTEATVAVPEAGGSSSFARHGLGELMSFVAGWATMLSYTVTISISAFAVSGYLSVFFPTLSTYPANVIFTVALIGLLMLLNVVGVREATTMSVVFAVLDLVTQLLLVAVGAITILNIPLLISQVDFGTAPTWGNFIYGISIAMVAYTGIETISNMVEEARQPERTVPRSYGLLIVAVLVLFGGISVVGLSAMPVYQLPDGVYTTELATTYVHDPVAGIAAKLPEPLNQIFEPMVAGLASTILLIAANAGIMGVSRLSFAMGSYRQLPRMFSQVHRTFRTPYFAVIFYCVIAAAIVLPGNLGDISDVYIFGAMLTFTLAHVSVIAMRIRVPGLTRPFRLGLSPRIAGVEIPLTAVVGGLGTFAVWLLVVFSRPFGRWVGLGWMLVGLGLYVYYRRSNRLGLNETVRLAARPAPAGGAESSQAGRAVRTR
ncbi:MAG: amino acid permease [Chloroflexi bacterium]|nr:amino acid permease [Chloroflexota bacterium]